MMKSVSAIEGKFLRSKIRVQSTKLWRELEGEKRNKVLSKMSLLVGENIVLCFFPSGEYWWVISNERLIICVGNRMRYLPFSEIDKISLGKMFAEETTKEENTSLRITAKSGVIDLTLERGTWPVVYEILRFASS